MYCVKLIKRSVCMGLFSKKSSKTATAVQSSTAAAKIADDIWDTPVRNTADRVRTDVKIKEVNSSTPSVFNGPRGISPKVLEEKMAELQKELEERENRAPEHYILDEIPPSTMRRANAEFEKEVEEITFKAENTTYGNIKPAAVENMEEKVRQLDEQYNYLTSGVAREIDIEGISEEDYERQLDLYQEEIAKKRHEIIRRMPGLTESQKEAIREFFELDIVAKPMEYVNSIPELSERDLAKIRKQLEEIYALENAPAVKNEMKKAD